MKIVKQNNINQFSFMKLYLPTYSEINEKRKL